MEVSAIAKTAKACEVRRMAKSKYGSMGKGKKIKGTNIPEVKVGNLTAKGTWKGPMPKRTLSSRRKGQKEFWEKPKKLTIGNVLTFR